MKGLSVEFGAQCSRVGVQDSGFRVQVHEDLGVMIQDSGFRVKGLGFRVWG